MFARPEYFALLGALALAGWYWRTLNLFSPIRIIIILLATFALAGPRWKRQERSVDLYVLLDRSHSTGNFVDKSLPEWKAVFEKHKPSSKDEIHYINFASEVAQEGDDGSTFTGARDLTRTGLALRSIVSQASEKRPARVLLFSDGYSTENLDAAGAQMAARGIPLDYRILRGDNLHDYRITNFSLPNRVQAGEPFLLSVSAHGSADAVVPLAVRRNGEILTESKIQFVDGVGKLEFTDRLPQTGAYNYSVEIFPEVDAHEGNNKAAHWLEVIGGPRLILVTKYIKDPLAVSLEGQGFSVQTISDLSQLKVGLLAGARAVIFNNVLANEIPSEFLKDLDFFVREQGGGFMMVGGKHSFGSGGYFQSPLDELLPVSLELKNEHRKLTVALAIVMDRSGSMSVNVDSNTKKIDLADSGAAAAIDLLSPNDQIAVFAVDTQAHKIVPLTQIGSHHNELSQKVMQITSGGGGIYIYEGLKAAWEELKKSPAGTRHIILFADASDSQQSADYINLLAEINKGGATVSVIGLGTQKDIHATLLEDIAVRGNGRVFFSDKPLDLPKIFAQETVTIARSAFIDQKVKLQATGRWDEISPKELKWPVAVDGYNLSYAKPDATVSLVSKDKYLAPLIAHARRGLGRSVAVSFPLGGDYSEAIRGWPGYSDFCQTLGRYLLGEDIPPGVALQQRMEGTSLTLDLLYDTEEWSDKLAKTPPVIRLQEGYDGTASAVPWRRVSPGHFQLSRNLAPGVTVRGAAQVGNFVLPLGPISVGDSPEWAFPPERVRELRTISTQTGGRELTDLSNAWLRPPSVGETDLRIPLCIALLCFVLLDALLTKTGWKLPELSLAHRFRKPKFNDKPLSSKKNEAIISRAEASAFPVEDLADEAIRRKRFQRAKDRK